MVETVIVLVPLTAATLVVVVAPVELFTNMSGEFAGRPK